MAANAASPFTEATGAAQATMAAHTPPAPRPAKVGTQPWLIIIKGDRNPKVGESIEFRRADSGEKWTTGRVTSANPDGYLFIELI